MDDPYKTLASSPDASLDAIRQAYRKLAKQHHPDLNPVAQKPRRSSRRSPPPMGCCPIRTSAGNMIGVKSMLRGQERARRPAYREHADGASGHRYSQGAQENWGAEDLATFLVLCSEAAGGRAARSARTAMTNAIPSRPTFWRPSTARRAGSRCRMARVLDVKIPAGANEGLVMRLRGQGGAGINGGKAGDALIEIHVMPHPFFERSGQDIRLTLPISLPEAVLGRPVEVRTPLGPVKMQIPPGSDSGTELRLRGRGVPQSKGHAAGDLYATLRVMIGKPDAALGDFVREWKQQDAVNPRGKMESVP